MLAVLGICVGYMYVLWDWSAPGAVYILAICRVGCLLYTWCRRGVALVKFQTFPTSSGRECVMYELTRDEVNCHTIMKLR